MPSSVTEPLWREARITWGCKSWFSYWEPRGNPWNAVWKTQMQLPSKESWFELLRITICWVGWGSWIPVSLLLSPPARGFSSAHHTGAGHTAESIWGQPQRGPWCSPSAATSPWENPLHFQANFSSSCSFPEEGYNPHCTQYTPGHDLGKGKGFL